MIQLFSYHVADAVKEGRLKILLEDFEPPPLPVSIIYLGGGLLPLKVRAFIDFAAPQLKADLRRILLLNRAERPTGSRFPALVRRHSHLFLTTKHLVRLAKYRSRQRAASLMIGDDGSKNFVLSITYSTGLLACAAVTLLRIAWIVRAGRARAMGITMRPVSLAIWAASIACHSSRRLFRGLRPGNRQSDAARGTGFGRRESRRRAGGARFVP